MHSKQDGAVPVVTNKTKQGRGGMQQQLDSGQFLKNKK